MFDLIDLIATVKKEKFNFVFVAMVAAPAVSFFAVLRNNPG